MIRKVIPAKLSVEVLCIFIFTVTTNAHSSHNFHGTSHSSNADHIAFLGRELAGEFDKLTPEESRRRLR